jgi:Integrase core domain
MTGFVYLHSAVDGYSRLAYTVALDDENAATATGFMRRTTAFFAAMHHEDLPGRHR